jgi:DNA repair ATPase RecN
MGLMTMKIKVMQKILTSLFITGLALRPVLAKAQLYEAERLVLDIEKLAQLKSILTNLYNDYEILETGYSAIKNISEGNFNLHKVFLDGLLAVSPTVQKYERIVDIIDDQGRIVSEYQTAYNVFKQDKHFNPDELVYLMTVYNNLMDLSAKNLTNLLNVITASKLRMSDAERLHAIDGIYGDTKDALVFLRSFNDDTKTMAVQRARAYNDIETINELYSD